MLQRRGDGVVAVGEGASLHSQDLQPPILVLGQAQSQGITAGMFQRTDTQEEFESIEVVPLAVRPSRLKWPAGKFSRDMRLECWSDDGIAGSTRSIKNTPAKYPGQPCVGCQFYTAKPWDVDAEEGWCMPGYNVLLVDAESFETYLMRLKGAAAKVARLMVARGVFQKAVIRLTSEHVSQPTGIWEQLKAKTVRKLDEADQSLVHAQYAAFAGSAVQGDDSPAAAQSEDAASSPAITETRRASVTNGFEVTVMGEVEMRYTPTGKAIATAMGRTPQGYKKLLAWESLAEQFNAEVNKGDVLVVTGKYGVYEWSGHDGQANKEEQLVLSNFQRLGFHDSGGGPAQNPANLPPVPEDPMEGLPF